MTLWIALALLLELHTYLPNVDPNAKMPPGVAVCANAAADARQCFDVNYSRTFELQGAVESADLIQGDVVLRLRIDKTAPKDTATGEWIVRAPGYVLTQHSGLMHPGQDVIALVWRFNDLDCKGGCKAQAHGLEAPCSNFLGTGSTGTAPPPCDDVWSRPPNWGAH